MKWGRRAATIIMAATATAGIITVGIITVGIITSTNDRGPLAGASGSQDAPVRYGIGKDSVRNPPAEFPPTSACHARAVCAAAPGR